MGHMKKCMPDVIISIVLLAFLGTLSMQMPSIPKDSKTYPSILLGLSYIMVVILLIRSVLAIKKSEVVETHVLDQMKILFPYAVIIVAYLALLGKIGYIFDTLLFSFVSLIYLKFRNKLVMIVLSLVMTLLLYFVFTRFLSVILPRGSWISLNL
ncbi:MAG: tripartite tricarboxylate transporter TctB family protein [Clostridiales bacterium]|nr:tripartite tricarboxylate transporter TctB family protein [Clostridiales bacterium]